MPAPQITRAALSSALPLRPKNAPACGFKRGLRLGLAAATALALCSACSLTATSAAAHRIVGHIQPDIPVFRGYSIERKQDYPISKATPLYVAGEDPEIVSALAGQLSVYFLSVEEINDSATLRPGFILQFASSAKSTNKNITLTVADSSNQQVFDTINIVVEDGASEAGEKRRLDAAMSRAAALLAGES